ncbi:MAG: competence/damage-inducible protein A [Gemmatimonadota bacterium]
MDCELLTVGTELLLGLTVDTNAADIGRVLAAAGVRVVRRTSVADDPAQIRDAVRAALQRARAVIVSGGLGPTKDDLTKHAVAEVLGKRLLHDPAVLAQLEELYRRRGIPRMPEANRSQADVPEGATVLPNKWGTAPGLWIEDGDGRVVVLLPGVPVEMRGLLEQEVLPRLKQRMAGTGAQGHGGTEVVRSRVVRTTGIAESALADLVGDPARLVPPSVTLAWLPSYDGTDLRLTAWRLPPDEADAALEAGVQALRPRLGAHCYGEGDTDLAGVVLDLLAAKGARLATAESCTGGLIGQRVTAIPGSSKVFLGGVVAYGNDVKLHLLGVSAETVTAHGAVSEPVVREMVEGVARMLEVDAALAVTGIAGPSGAVPGKPVGTVWIGVSWRGGVRAFTHVLPGGRDAVRRRAAQWALDYLRRVVAELI